MATSIKERLYAAASVDAGLLALLGNPIQWGDIQAKQNWDLTTKSAVTVQLISNPSNYQLPGRMLSSTCRMQFTIFGHGSNSQNAEAVAVALYNFFGNLAGNGLGVLGIPNDRDGGIADTQPLTYMRMIDCFLFNDESF